MAFTITDLYLITCDLCRKRGPVVAHDYDRFINGNVLHAEEHKKLYTHETINKIVKATLKAGFICIHRPDVQLNAVESIINTHFKQNTYLCAECANTMHSKFAPKQNTKLSLEIKE